MYVCMYKYIPKSCGGDQDINVSSIHIYEYYIYICMYVYIYIPKSCGGDQDINVSSVHIYVYYIYIYQNPVEVTKIS